ncbi:MAG: hypothetical protein SF028_05475 [Candidatus Sumerlaeia bacterium]|nr:hypothetical protein [Candidatus Sumerlaeia bacterium]
MRLSARLPSLLLLALSVCAWAWLGEGAVYDEPPGPWQYVRTLARALQGVVFALGVAGWGRAALAWAGWRVGHPWERAAWAVGAGSALFGAFFGWAALLPDGLRGAAWRLALAVLWLGAWFTAAELPRLLRALAGPARRAGRVAFAGAALLAALFVLRFWEALSPPMSWDELMYHLPMAERLPAHGWRAELPGVLQSWFPMGTVALQSLALELGDAAVARTVQWLHGGALALALAAMAARLGAGRLSIVAPFFFYAMPMMFHELAHVQNDVTIALGSLLAARAVLFRSPPGWRAWVLLGLVAGFHLPGAKYTGGPLLLLLAAVALRRLRGAALRGGPAFAAGCLAAFAMWHLRNLLGTGNPVYPFLGAWFPTPGWSTEQHALMMSWLSTIGNGREPLDYLLLLPRLATGTVEAGTPFDFELPLAVPLLSLPVLGAVSSPRLRALCFLWWAGFAVWALGSQQVRLLSPAWPFACVLAAVQLAWLARWLRRRLPGVSGAASAVAVALALIDPARSLGIAVAVKGYVAPSTLAYQFGLLSARDFVRTRIGLPELLEHRAGAFRREHRRAPRVLLLLESRSYYALAQGIELRQWAIQQAAGTALLAAECDREETVFARLSETERPDYLIVASPGLAGTLNSLDGMLMNERDPAARARIERYRDGLGLLARTVRRLGWPAGRAGDYVLYEWPERLPPIGQGAHPDPFVPGEPSKN